MSISELLGLRDAHGTTAARTSRSRPSRWTVAIAALVPATLVTGWIAADAVQPRRYSPVRQSISVTAGYAGTHRWVMTTALVAIGLCYLIGAVAFNEVGTCARFGLMLAAAAAIGIAANPVPVHGAGVQHDMWTAVGGVTITFWPLLTTRRPGDALAWTQRLDVGLAISIAFSVLSGWLVVEALSGSAVGLAERVSASLVAIWPAVLAASLHAATTPSALPPSKRSDQPLRHSVRANRQVVIFAQPQRPAADGAPPATNR